MSAVSFYTQNASPKHISPSPLAVIHTDSGRSAPEAQITLDREEAKKARLSIGDFFIIYGVDQIFRVQEISTEKQEVTVTGKELLAFLMEGTVAEQDIIPPEGAYIPAFITGQVTTRRPAIPASLVSIETASGSHICTQIWESGSTLMEYLSQEMEELSMWASFSSVFAKKEGTGWPVSLRLDVWEASQTRVVPVPSKEVIEWSTGETEREDTEQIFTVSGIQPGGPQGSSAVLSYPGLSTAFHYRPAYDEVASAQKLFSSIGVIQKKGEDLSASSLSYDALRRWIWDWQSTRPVDDAIYLPGQTQPTARELIYFRAWDTIQVPYQGGVKEVPALTVGLASPQQDPLTVDQQTAYGIFKLWYESIIEKTLSLDGTYDPDEHGHYAVQWRSLGEDGQPDSGASQIWYRGRGWLTQISIYDPAWLEVDIDSIPAGGRFIKVSDISTVEGDDTKAYSAKTSPEQMYPPILISALEVKLCYSMGYRTPQKEVDISFAPDFVPLLGEELLVRGTGFSMRGLVTAVTRTEEAGQTSYDLEVGEWLDEEAPEE